MCVYVYDVASHPVEATRCISIYVYMYEYIHVYVYILIHVYIYLYIYTYIHIYACMHVLLGKRGIYKYMYVCIQT